MRRTGKVLLSLLACGTLSFGITLPNLYNAQAAKRATAYDISGYQGYFTQPQADNLKKEVNFMVLKTQGGDAADPEYYHNENLMTKAGIHYGVYSYSYYTSIRNAKLEAKELYERSPYADFYVNDAEQNDVGSDYRFDLATRAWADELKKLTNRPVVLYSGEYFMNTHITQTTRNDYDAIWLAAYGMEPDPTYHYDLWQFGQAYSPALGERIDADDFPMGTNKPLSFWEGTNVRGQKATKVVNHIHHHHVKNKFNYSLNWHAIVHLQNMVNSINVNNQIVPQYLQQDKNILGDLQNQLNNAQRNVKGHKYLIRRVNKTLKVVKGKLNLINQIQNSRNTQNNSNSNNSSDNNNNNNSNSNSSNSSNNSQIPNNVQNQINNAKKNHNKVIITNPTNPNKKRKVIILKPRRHIHHYAKHSHNNQNNNINNNYSKRKVIILKPRRKPMTKHQRRIARAKARKLRHELRNIGNYYRSPRVRALKVKAPVIRLYTKRSGYNDYIHVYKGTHIKHVHFTREHWHGYIITRAYAKYYGHWVQFTSNKNYVKWLH